MDFDASLFKEIAAFSLVVLAAWQLGRFSALYRLPLISGYLFAGMVSGPFLLKIISAEGIESLRFVDEISLGFIAFAAGGKMYLRELRSRLRSIVWVTAGITAATFTLGSLTLLLLSDQLAFLRALPWEHKLAVSLLAGAIFVARSPSSAIAIVSELKAKGPYTKTVLGVTVVLDGIVIVLFSLSSSAGDALLTQTGWDPTLLLLMTGELATSVLLGHLLSRVLLFFLRRKMRSQLKLVLILGGGYSIFSFCRVAGDFCHRLLPFDIFLEPLLICMIASFLVTNHSAHRPEFLRLLEKAGPVIYTVFFTLTGASLGLDMIAQIWLVVLVLFGVRLVGIFLGSFGGGLIAGDPMRHNCIFWMAFITQAGIGIGLAKEVSIRFPEWGHAFATVIISVIVLNQIVGPPFFKAAIRKVGESHLPRGFGGDRVGAVILGIEGQSIALARQLQAHNWRVSMVDTDLSHVERMAAEEIESHGIRAISREVMSSILRTETLALVAMLPDDQANYKACEIARRVFAIPRIVVRVKDISRARQFMALGAVVISPGSAMVNLLDQSVRSPESAAMILHQDSEYEMEQIIVGEKDVVGVPVRNLRLPTDVLILSIQRDGHSMVAHGYISLQMGDEVNLMGTAESLQEVARRIA